MTDADHPAGPAALGSDLGPDERAELERLRTERAKPKRRYFSWRPTVATILVVIGCLLAPVAVLGVWAGNTVTNTDRYVATMEPLIHNPAIQNALTDKITNEITSQLNVTASVNQAATLLAGKGLPRVSTLLKGYAPAISSAVTGFVHSQVHTIVSSQQFARIWVQVNRTVHAQLVKVLSGQGPSSVSVSNGHVVLSLGPFIDVVKQDLVNRGFTVASKIPHVNPTLTLFEAKYLVKAQTAYRGINTLKIVLPILALLLLAGGVFVARNHRRALIGAGLGLAVSMLVPAAGLLLFRGIYLKNVPSNVLSPDAAAALFDTLVHFIKLALRTVLAVGLVVAAGAFLTGPSATAVKSRAAITSGLGWLRHRGERAGVNTGPVGTWTYAHRRALRISAVALAALIFVFWGQPTAVVVIVIVVLLLVVLGLIELIGVRPPAPPDPPAPPAPPAEPGMAASL